MKARILAATPVVICVAMCVTGCSGGNASSGDVAGAGDDTAVAGDASATGNDAGAARDDDDATADPGSDTDDGTPVEDPEACKNPGTAGATARCLTPKFPPEYYVAEALKYFDTLDTEADRNSVPAYSELVARWEWPPWLLLTGFDKETMISTNLALLDYDPSTVPFRDCRFFEVQPFARCYVEFEYEEGPCPIYEEFTFNDQGETTFIEAWSDLPGMLPMADTSDTWAEGTDIHRLANRVPGLGNETGLIDLDSTWMKEAGEADPEVADFAMRAADMWPFWYELLNARPDDFFAQGCGW